MGDADAAREARSASSGQETELHDRESDGDCSSFASSRHHQADVNWAGPVVISRGSNPGLSTSACATQRPRPAVMASACAVVLLAIVFCFAGSPLHAEPMAEKQGADLAKLFDSVVDTVDKKFFDEATLRQVDWRRRANEVRPSALAA